MRATAAFADAAATVRAVTEAPAVRWYATDHAVRRLLDTGLRDFERSARLAAAAVDHRAAKSAWLRCDAAELAVRAALREARRRRRISAEQHTRLREAFDRARRDRTAALVALEYARVPSPHTRGEPCPPR